MTESGLRPFCVSRIKHVKERECEYSVLLSSFHFHLVPLNLQTWNIIYYDMNNIIIKENQWTVTTFKWENSLLSAVVTYKSDNEVMDSDSMSLIDIDNCTRRNIGLWFGNFCYIDSSKIKSFFEELNMLSDWTAYLKLKDIGFYS